ncbi:hypothetical protein ACSBR2_008542 [Camellia fascicularis]
METGIPPSCMPKPPNAITGNISRGWLMELGSGVPKLRTLGVLRWTIFNNSSHQVVLKKWSKCLTIFNLVFPKQ